MIESDRLVLRPCRPSDKPLFVGILNTPRMMEHLGGVQPADAIEALVDRRMADQAKHGMSYWAVELRQTRQLIGTCGVRIADNYAGSPVHGMHEIGWRIAEPFWGRGYAVEAARASLVWAWANTAAPHVASWTTKDNERSLAVMKCLGMERHEELDFRDVRPGAAGSPRTLIVCLALRPRDGRGDGR